MAATSSRSSTVASAMKCAASSTLIGAYLIEPLVAQSLAGFGSCKQVQSVRRFHRDLWNRKSPLAG